MSFSISTLLTRTLHDVFGENDPAPQDFSALLLLTKRGDQRPCGARTETARSHERPTAGGRAATLIGTRVSNRVARTTHARHSFMNARFILRTHNSFRTTP
jgi:hypothetical protein